MIHLAPSILAADFSRLGEQVAQVTPIGSKLARLPHQVEQPASGDLLDRISRDGKAFKAEPIHVARACPLIEWIG